MLTDQLFHKLGAKHVAISGATSRVTFVFVSVFVFGAFWKYARDDDGADQGYHILWNQPEVLVGALSEVQLWSDGKLCGSVVSFQYME